MARHDPDVLHRADVGLGGDALCKGQKRSFTTEAGSRTEVHREVVDRLADAGLGEVSPRNFVAR